MFLLYTKKIAMANSETSRIKKDTKMINLAGFVEELIEVGKGEGVCWDGTFYLFATVEGQGASVVCARLSLIVLYNKPITLTARRQLLIVIDFS
jgi:hypothetical protein